MENQSKYLESELRKDWSEQNIYFFLRTIEDDVADYWIAKFEEYKVDMRKMITEVKDPAVILAHELLK